MSVFKKENLNMRAEKTVVVKSPEKQTQQLLHGQSFPRTEKKFMVYFYLGRLKCPFIL